MQSRQQARRQQRTNAKLVIKSSQPQPKQTSVKPKTPARPGANNNKNPSKKNNSRIAPSIRAPVKGKIATNNNINPTRGIPRTAPSKPLRNAMTSQDRIHGNLKKKSPWYQAIMNPAQGAGIKIPDDVGVETGTLQLSFESAFTTNASGIGGWRCFTPYPNAIGGAGTPGENYNILNPASGVASLTWLSGAPFPTNEVLRAYSRAVRITSYALYCQPEVSLAEAQGEMILSFDIFGFNEAPDIDTHRNSFGAGIMPLNECKPMKVIWTPASRNQNTYKSFFDTYFESFGQDDNEVPTWHTQILVQGCAPSQVFRVRCVVNYEFIPYANAIDILSANPSPMDATEVDLVESWVADTPATRPSSTTEISTAPGAAILEDHGPQDGGPTGFGMFFDILTEVLPEALEVLPALF